MQLLKVMDMWTEMLESGSKIDVVYTDLEKAFDKVPHKRLYTAVLGQCSGRGVNLPPTHLKFFMILTRNVNDYPIPMFSGSRKTAMLQG